MSFLDSILKPLAITAGVTALGGAAFPETMGSLTGGLVGQKPLPTGVSGPLQSPSFFGLNLPSFGTAAASSAGGGGSSFWSPEVLSAGIMSAASLFSNLYGTDLDDAQLAQAQQQFEQNLALSREKLAQDKELTLAQLAASREGAGAAAAAAKRQADIQLAGLKSQSADRIADRRIEARKGKSELTLAGRTAQAAQAANTGRLGLEAFRNLIGAVQAPLLA